MDDKKLVFVADEDLSGRIKDMQKELNLKSPAEVIAMGLSLLELSVGRNIEIQEKDKKYKIKDLAKYNQTFAIEDDGDSE